MIANKVKEYLAQHQTQYRTIPHVHTEASMQTAEMAHVPGDKLAKAVVLDDAQGTLMAVIPSDFHLDLADLNSRLQRNLEFTEESELAPLFPDCEPGAVPPLGPAYGIATIWDTKLGEETTVYFEAGDHETLVQLSGKAFHELMVPAERGHFSHHV